MHPHNHPGNEPRGNEHQYAFKKRFCSRFKSNKEYLKDDCYERGNSNAGASAAPDILLENLLVRFGEKSKNDAYNDGYFKCFSGGY